jgi:hypothetical protein
MIGIFKSAYDRIYMFWHEGETHTPNFLDVTNFSHSFTDVREVEYNSNDGVRERYEEVDITVTSQMVLNQECQNNANDYDIELAKFFGYFKSYLKKISLKEKSEWLSYVFTLNHLENHFETQKDKLQFLQGFSKALYQIAEKERIYL